MSAEALETKVQQIETPRKSQVLTEEGELNLMEKAAVMKARQAMEYAWVCGNKNIIIYCEPCEVYMRNWAHTVGSNSLVPELLVYSSGRIKYNDRTLNRTRLRTLLKTRSQVAAVDELGTLCEDQAGMIELATNILEKIQSQEGLILQYVARQLLQAYDAELKDRKVPLDIYVGTREDDLLPAEMIVDSKKRWSGRQYPITSRIIAALFRK